MNNNSNSDTFKVINDLLFLFNKYKNYLSLVIVYSFVCLLR